MKQTYFLITILYLVSFQGCKKSNPQTPTHPAPTYTLTVNGGVGSGNYLGGDSVYVFSNPPAENQVFNGWAGDTQGMVSPKEWRSVLKMPQSAVNITATYKTINPVTFTNVVINGSQAYYYVPSNYRGILMPFHGTGGSAINWTEQQAENVNFCTYAAANGYAIVVTESVDRTNLKWDLSAGNNTDINNIDSILASLELQGIISSTKPFYGVGMSDGSAFCSLIAYEKNFKAEALYCLGGIDVLFPTTTIPTIWNLAAKDVVMDPTRNAQAVTNYNTLKSRGISCQLYINQPTPLYPSRCTIIPGINSTASTSIYNAFNTAGYLSKESFFNVDPMSNTAWESAIPSTYTLAEAGISDQIYVAYAEHKFYKDSNYRTISFFNGF